MAWLDDSPFGQGQGSALRSTAGLQPDKSRIVIWLLNLPLINIPFRKYYSLFLSLLVTLRLNQIEKKINQCSFDHTEEVTPFLRELLKTKQLLSDIFIRSLKRKLFARNRILKKSLIKKSYETYSRLATAESVKMRIDSTHQVLAQLIENKSTIVNIPSKLHWVHTRAQDLKISTLSSVKEVTPKLIYLQTSCQSLLKILTSTQNINALQEEVRINHHGFDTSEEEHFACGISVKLEPKFSQMRTTKNPAVFWQSRPLDNSKLAIMDLCDRIIPEYIQSIFFKTAEDYQEFMKLLQAKQLANIREWMTNYEAQEQIIIAGLPLQPTASLM